mmetsp:Transcript_16750/g.41844  ORF Transcript_16750/g.41844 Transcript_16750/m.41844 type:complete len:264 (+) Transcript_16750:7617-8408(+)
MERNNFPILAHHSIKDSKSLLGKIGGRKSTRIDSCKHFRYMTKNLSGLAGVTQNLEKIIVTKEIETGEFPTLLLEILSQRLLDHGHEVAETFQRALYVFDVEDFHCKRTSSNAAHESDEFGIDTLESRPFGWKLCLNVGATEKNTLEVHPSSLNIDPDIESGTELRQTSFPQFPFLLEFSHSFVIWGALHESQTTNVIIEAIEKIIPSSDQSNTILEENQFQFLLHPTVTNLCKELFKSHFTLGDGQNLSDFLLAIQNSLVPE